jgi:hypothetical protein
MRFFALGIIFLIFCCSSKRDAQGSVSVKSDDSLAVALTNFTDDSLGCEGLRTKRGIEFLYDRAKLNGMERSELLRLIGHQNDSTVANGLLNLKFYYDRLCTNGVPIDSADRCWANIYIDLSTQKVSGIKFICE